MQVRIQIIPARMDLLPREVDTVANLLRGTLLSLIKVRLQLNYLMVHNIARWQLRARPPPRSSSCRAITSVVSATRPRIDLFSTQILLPARIERALRCVRLFTATRLHKNLHAAPNSNDNRLLG